MEHTQRAERTHRAERAQAASRPRSVPSDWYLDPADPEASVGVESLEDRATALLSAHGLEDESGTPAATVTALFPDADRPVEAAPAQDWDVIPGLAGEPIEGELAWQADALCAQTDPEAFFPEKGGSTRDAKRVCEACIVKDRCLDYAMDNDERFGIWGGLSERERRRLRRLRG